MYSGNQVLRVENQYKKGDLYNIGKELSEERKGTGNYDKNRTQFNYEYVSIKERNLYQEVFKKLKDEKIEYNDRATTNFMNGAIITSGPEFFQSLGINFVESGRFYETGKRKGKPILVPDIKSTDDIPDKVKKFFDDSFEFIKNEVGEKNILVAQIHYDEDTPHMQVYFLPRVNRVLKKVYETDEAGNSITIKVKNEKSGKEVSRPVEKKDDKGKTIYEEHFGNFLNNDQFWKSRGGKYSFATLQDKYNEYITEKGFNLFRGNIGANVKHKTKLEHQVEELDSKLNDIKVELDKNEKYIDSERETTRKLKNVHQNEVYSPDRKAFGGYKEESVDKLIDYAKTMEKDSILKQKSIDKRDDEILSKNASLERLIEENMDLKSGEALKQKDRIIESQKQQLSEKNTIINNLKEKINTLEEKLEEFKDGIYKFCNKLCKAISHLIGNGKISDYEKIDYNEFEDIADNIIYDYKQKDRDISDDFCR